MRNIKTEDDIIELAGEIQTYLPEDISGEQMEKAIEYQIMSILGRQISMAAGLISKKQQQLDDSVMKLKDALAGFDGSEVRDQNIQRCTSWVHQQEAQLSFLEDWAGGDMESAKAAYLGYFGKAWVPYSQNQAIRELHQETAAAFEAKELLAKYAK